MPIEIDIPYGLNDFARTIMNTDKLGASCTENTANSYKSYINGIYKLYDNCLSGDTPISPPLSHLFRYGRRIG